MILSACEAEEQSHIQGSVIRGDYVSHQQRGELYLQGMIPSKCWEKGLPTSSSVSSQMLNLGRTDQRHFGHARLLNDLSPRDLFLRKVLEQKLHQNEVKEKEKDVL